MSRRLTSTSREGFLSVFPILAATLIFSSILTTDAFIARPPPPAEINAKRQKLDPPAAEAPATAAN